MASTLLHDLAVKTGEYQDNQGNTKGRYENIGKVMRNDNGQFILLKKTFNPAGVNGNGDMVMVSMFDPKPRGGNGGGSSGGQSQGGYDQSPLAGGGHASPQGSYGDTGPSSDIEDEVPF